MTKVRWFSREVRERAVRQAREHQGDCESQWSAITSIAGKIGCTEETLRLWCGQRNAIMGSAPE